MVYSIVELKEMQKVGRFDPEYYSPYYLQLDKQLKSCGGWTIADIASPSPCAFDANKTDQFDYVEISDIDLQIGSVTSTPLSADKAPSRAQLLLEGGEVLVSTLRPNRSCIGLVSPNLEGKVVVASSGFVPLRAQDEKHRSFLFALL